MKDIKFIYTKDVVDIKSIKDGVIETKSGNYIKLVEVDPINFHLRSDREKNEIIQSFASWLKIAPVQVQFKVLSQKTDIQKHIKTINEEMQREENMQCRELQREYMGLLYNVGLREGVSRRFFVILKYTNKGLLSDDYSNIVNTLNVAFTQLKTYLRQCGNKVVEHNDEDVFLSNLYYEIYNRNIKDTITDRINDIATYTQQNEIDFSEVSIEDILAPYNFEVFKDYILVNDKTYYSFLYIPANGYKSQVYGGWMSSLINMGEGVDVDVYIERQNRSKMIERVGRDIRLNKVKMNDTQDTNTDFDMLGDSIRGGYYLKQGMSSGMDLWLMSTIITVCASSLDELKYKINFIKDTLIACDMSSRVPNYQMLHAFRSVIPQCDFHEKICKKTRRNALTSGIASTYMFTSFEMSDDNGILLGINQQNNSLCILDIFDSTKYKNANMAILGTSGSGKTFLISMMGLRMRMKNIQTFILAPFKGREYFRACKNIGGEFIKIGPGATNCINVMDIRPEDRVATDLIDDSDSFKTTCLVSKKIQDLSTFFTLLIPDISNEEAQLLDNALIKTYEAKGIFANNNESLLVKGAVNPNNPNLPVYKEMPILEDLYNVLKTMDGCSRIANILDRYVHGSASAFNNHTNINLDNKYTVVDISDFPKELLPMGMFIALDFIYSKAKENITKKKAIVIDEAWRLIGAGSSSFAADYVLELFKIIRGYGGAAIVATQDIGDFFALEDGKYGKGIIANAKTKVLLQLETKEARTIKDIFELSEREVSDIARFEQGHGLIITNTNNVPVHFKASNKEYDLITTAREDSERLYNEKLKSLEKLKENSENDNNNP